MVVGFTSGFIGVWKRYELNNTLTFTATTLKSSNQNYAWNFISASGDAYTIEANTAAKTRMTLTFKLTRDFWDDNKINLVISGDSGNGENNLNGTWRKQ